MKRILCFGFIVMLIFLPSSSVAGIKADMTSFFHALGSHTNESEEGVYKDQAAGYYTGGSLFVRNANRVLQPTTLQMPGVNAGCGGIDMHMGGASFIQAKELVQFLRSIGSSAASYAFMLAIQSVSPQIYNVLNELNALAQQVNQFNIGSCEAAATMVGSVWPKSDASSQHLCKAMGSSMGGFSDWASARQGCGVKGGLDSTLDKAGQKYKHILVGEYNLSWKALKQNPFLQSDQELVELFMTLTGTLISRKTGQDYEIVTLSSLADQRQLLKALLEGGQTSVYRCNDAGAESKCLAPTLFTITIAPDGAFKGRVHRILEGLVNKIHEDSPLTAEEKGFLNSTRLPVYKILNVMTAYRKGQSPLDVHEYADLIALDIVHHYILSIIDLVFENMSHLRSSQVDETHLTRLQDQLFKARERLVERRHSAFQQLNTALSLIQKTRAIEKQLHAMMSSLPNEEKE